MTLTTPHYIRTANIQDHAIRFKWDEWNLEDAEGPIDDEVFSRLSAVSQRACVAFTIGCGEWILHRFEPLLRDPIPLHHLEARWAQIIDVLYSFPWRFTHDEDWDGPIKGPVRRTMELVTDVVTEMVTDAEPALCASIISTLAVHVIAEPKPFHVWRGRVIDQLERLYSRNPDEKMGDVVPREALDPDADFQPEQTERLVNVFLSQLDYRDNRLLHTPAEMIAEGFEGVPYTFDIEEDRRARFDW